MNNAERNRFAALHYVVGTVLLFVCIWDFYGLKVTGWAFYYPMKIVAIGTYFLVGYLVKNEKLNPQTGFDISCVVFYLYSFLGTKYLHSTYIFAFYGGLCFISFYYAGPVLRYLAITVFGTGLALISTYYMPEPDFVKVGASIKPHLYLFTIIFGILGFVIYWFFNRQREIIYQKDQKFASIGRQSAFLLHELKSPLSRFMMSNSEKDNRDADYILSIVEGVELLISKSENLSFVNFEWNNIKTYLEHEFEEPCRHYNIKLDILGFEGQGHGHISTIKLALKNLVKNAVEAIALEKTHGHIKISRDDNCLEVSNNGSVITKEKLNQIFTPFYSGKNSASNHGIGLHFVESVVKAHMGSIDVNVEDGWNIFKIRLGKMS